MYDVNSFTDWLLGEINRRDWSLNYLAQRAGLSRSAISKVLSGAGRPGWEFCRKVATALHMPPEKVFRLAGLLPAEPNETAVLREMIYLFRQLSPEDQERFVTFVRAFITESRRRERPADEGRKDR